MLEVTTQNVSLTNPNDRPIESNVVAENIFSMDSCVENSSEALRSESTIKEHSEDILLDVYVHIVGIKHHALFHHHKFERSIDYMDSPL